MATDRADTVIEVSVKTDEILKWARFMQEIPKRTPRAIANSLNAAGDEILRQSIDYLADMTGLDVPDVQNAIAVRRATPSRLEWSMDASAITLEESPNWERPWESSSGDKSFKSQQLLKIITSEDFKVCPVCEEAAENSPYTPEDINKLAAKWKDYEPPHPVEGPRTNLVHPNCRCVTVPWEVSRRLNVNFAAARPRQKPVVLTMHQLSEIIAQELGGVLRAT